MRHRCGVGQLDGAGLPGHLAADLVAVVDVHRHLDVDEDAVGHLEEHEQRVLQRAAAAAPPGREHLDGDDLGAEQPAQLVDLVDGGVGDGHVAGVVRGHGGVAVGAVRQQRSADGAAVDGLLEGPVRGVVAAVEADLDQPPAGGDLGLDDAPAGVLRGRQRLLAEDGLAGSDAGQHVRLVGGPPGGDDDGVDRVGRDQLLATGQGLRGRQLSRPRSPRARRPRRRRRPRGCPRVRRPAGGCAPGRSCRPR